MGELTLVLGGMRSGKSAAALELARAEAPPVTYAATGVASDEEMRVRIERHRQIRPREWGVVETPIELEEAVGAGPGAVLLESVDGWLANLMDAAGGAEANFRGPLGERLVDRCAGGVGRMAARNRHLIAVSSEVGLSLVPLHPYGRAFADLLGTVNQRLAARARRIYLSVAGIPVPLHALRERPR